MSVDLWHKMPPGLLKKTYGGWRRLDPQVRRLVFELATSQHFKCYFCDQSRDLVIDHDYDPHEGPGDRLTIHNVRGLLCGTCNWHLGVYEKEKRGEDFGWANGVMCKIDDGKIEYYIESYECRIINQYEKSLERRMERIGANYWHRRLVLQEFDNWFYYGARSVWRDEWERRQFLKIRTPKDFFRVLEAVVEFLQRADEDPDFEWSDEILVPLSKLQSLLERLMADVKEARRQRSETQGHALISAVSPPASETGASSIH